MEFGSTVPAYSLDMVEIRECVEGDPDLLEQRMPTGGHQAHAGHFARQGSAIATYLVAWRQAVPVGTCLILWDGPVAAEIRSALPGAVEISNVHVYPQARGHAVGTALILAKRIDGPPPAHACTGASQSRRSGIA